MPRPDNPERNAQIVTAYRGGMTRPAIAEMFDLSERRVSQILELAGVTRFARAMTRDEQQVLRRIRARLGDEVFHRLTHDEWLTVVSALPESELNCT